MYIKRTRIVENVGFDMTPMIDVVFQLIIFLMLATEITQIDLERLQTPKASEATDDNPNKDRFIVNVSHEFPASQNCRQLRYDSDGNLIHPCGVPEHWNIIIRGNKVNRPELEKKLAIEADIDRDQAGNSNRQLMIRADAGSPYGFVERVLESASKARIYKIEIAAHKPAE